MGQAPAHVLCDEHPLCNEQLCVARTSLGKITALAQAVTAD